MGAFKEQQERGQALQLDLYRRRVARDMDAQCRTWETVRCELRERYTAKSAAECSTASIERIRRLEIAEPAPDLVDYLPDGWLSLQPLECLSAVSEINERLAKERITHRKREVVRTRELEFLRQLWVLQHAAEEAFIMQKQMRLYNLPVGTSQSLLAAAVVDTPAQFHQLIEDRHAHWELAAFASALVIERNALKAENFGGSDPRTSRRPFSFAPHSIDTADHLLEAFNVMCYEIDWLSQRLEVFMAASPFTRFFSGRADYFEPSSDHVLSTAALVTDLFADLLDFARELRDAAAAHNVDTVRKIIRLIDRPMQGYDAFINDYVGVITALPMLESTAPDEATLNHHVYLNFDIDDDLVSDIRRDIARARRPWWRWFS